MSRLLAIAAVLCAAAAFAAPPSPAEIRALVDKLGSEDFAERETAGKRLDELGAPAMEALRAALASDNAEVVQRARAILRRIDRRIDNEKTLAPTLVELDAKEQRLDDVLAELSKQTGWDVVLNGTKVKELADRKVTVSTAGKAPFWTAVQQICDAGELLIAGAGGFFAPDAMPFRTSRGEPGVRSARKLDQCVVLEARGSARARSAALFGAVLVEAVPLPGQSKDPAVLLQCWPEPRLNWVAVRHSIAASAVDRAGAKLAAKFTVAAAPKQTLVSDAVVIIRNPDGSASIVPASAAPAPGAFRPNPRQAVLSLPAGTTELKSLDLTVVASVRSGIEPLAKTAALELNRPATVGGPADVELTATIRKGANGRYTAEVQLAYDRLSVQPVGVGVDLAGAKGGGPGRGNSTVHGVRITDAGGIPYTLGLQSGSSGADRMGRERLVLQLELHPDRNGQGAPAQVAFWGTYAKPVEVPIVLKDIAFSPAK